MREVRQASTNVLLLQRFLQHNLINKKVLPSEDVQPAQNTLLSMRCLLVTVSGVGVALTVDVTDSPTKQVFGYITLHYRWFSDPTVLYSE